MDKRTTLKGRLSHPLTSTKEALEQMIKNGDELTPLGIRTYCSWCYCGKYHATGRTEPGQFSCDGNRNCKEDLLTSPFAPP